MRGSSEKRKRFCIENKVDVDCLFKAIKSGNIDLLRDLLGRNPDLIKKSGIDLSEYGYEGLFVPPLHFSVWFDNPEVVRFIHKGDPSQLDDVDDDDLETPLHWAAQTRCPRAFLTLLKLGADLTKQDRKGLSPLHWLIEVGASDCLIALLGSVDPESLKVLFSMEDLSGRTPYVIAKQNGRYGYLSLLEKYGAKDSIGEIEFSEGKISRSLVARLKGYLDQSASIQERLVKAFLDRNISVLSEFDLREIENLDVNVVVGGDDGGVRYRLFIQKEFLALLCLKSEDLRAIQDKMKHFSEMTSLSGMGALHWAIEGGRPDLISYLVSQGVDLNQTDSEGNTPLHYAVSPGRSSSLDELIRASETYGAPLNLNLKNHKGHSPYAEMYQFTEYDAETKTLLDKMRAEVIWPTASKERYQRQMLQAGDKESLEIRQKNDTNWMLRGRKKSLAEAISAALLFGAPLLLRQIEGLGSYVSVITSSVGLCSLLSLKAYDYWNLGKRIEESKQSGGAAAVTPDKKGQEEKELILRPHQTSTCCRRRLSPLVKSEEKFSPSLSGDLESKGDEGDTLEMDA